jgi:hypothetical protein
MLKLIHGIKYPKFVGYFCNFQVPAKVNDHPFGENSADLVTLILAQN